MDDNLLFCYGSEQEMGVYKDILDIYKKDTWMVFN
jgi:hypothetical protein